MHQVAEHSVGLLFAVIRQDRAVKTASSAKVYGTATGRGPTGTWLARHSALVGCGRIARLVARKLSGFELKVIACDPVVDAQSMGALGIEEGHLMNCSRNLISSRSMSLFRRTTRQMIGRGTVPDDETQSTF